MSLRQRSYSDEDTSGALGEKLSLRKTDPSPAHNDSQFGNGTGSLADLGRILQNQMNGEDSLFSKEVDSFFLPSGILGDLDTPSNAPPPSPASSGSTSSVSSPFNSFSASLYPVSPSPALTPISPSSDGWDAIDKQLAASAFGQELQWAPSFNSPMDVNAKEWTHNHSMEQSPASVQRSDKPFGRKRSNSGSALQDSAPSNEQNRMRHSGQMSFGAPAYTPSNFKSPTNPMKSPPADGYAVGPRNSCPPGIIPLSLMMDGSTTPVNGRNDRKNRRQLSPRSKGKNWKSKEEFKKSKKEIKARKVQEMKAIGGKGSSSGKPKRGSPPITPKQGDTKRGKTPKKHQIQQSAMSGKAVQDASKKAVDNEVRPKVSKASGPVGASSDSSEKSKITPAAPQRMSSDSTDSDEASCVTETETETGVHASVSKMLDGQPGKELEGSGTDSAIHSSPEREAEKCPEAANLSKSLLEAPACDISKSPPSQKKQKSVSSRIQSAEGGKKKFRKDSQDGFLFHIDTDLKSTVPLSKEMRSNVFAEPLNAVASNAKQTTVTRKDRKVSPRDSKETQGKSKNGVAKRSSSDSLEKDRCTKHLRLNEPPTTASTSAAASKISSPIPSLPSQEDRTQAVEPSFPKLNNALVVFLAIFTFVTKLSLTCMDALTGTHARAALAFKSSPIIPLTICYIYCFPWTALSLQLPSLVWHLFLVWLFTYNNKNARHEVDMQSPAGKLRILLPLLLIFEGVCNPRFIVSWNGSERLLLAFVLLWMKCPTIFANLQVIPTMALVCCSVIAGHSLLVQWLVLITFLATLELEEDDTRKESSDAASSIFVYLSSFLASVPSETSCSGYMCEENIATCTPSYEVSNILPVPALSSSRKSKGKPVRRRH